MKLTHATRILFFSLAGLLLSCASLDPVKLQDAISMTDAKEIEGTYIDVPSNVPHYPYNRFSKLIDHTDKTKNSDSISRVEITVISNKKIQFAFVDGQNRKYLYHSNYELKEGRIHLRNRNFRLTGIPYLFGGYKATRTELSLTREHQLRIRSTQKDEGAFLFFIPASLPVSKFDNVYSRIATSPQD